MYRLYKNYISIIFFELQYNLLNYLLNFVIYNNQASYKKVMTLLEENMCAIPDRQLVSMIISGHEEAGVFFVYVKYDKDVEYYVIRYYNTLDYKEELTNELYLHLRGRKGDWQSLKSFQWKCSLRTWFSSVASHLFIEQKKKLIGYGDVATSLDSEEGKKVAKTLGYDENYSYKYILMLEAINMLSNEEYRFILIKELEGYKANEIASMLEDKRTKEGSLRSRRDGTKIKPTADYIYMLKNRALKEVKQLIDKLRQKDSYGIQ